MCEVHASIPCIARWYLLELDNVRSIYPNHNHNNNHNNNMLNMVSYHFETSEVLYIKFRGEQLQLPRI